MSEQPTIVEGMIRIEFPSCMSLPERTSWLGFNDLLGEGFWDQWGRWCVSIPEPLQCYCCNRVQRADEVWTEMTVDFNLGNPENGPDPDICQVYVCPECKEKIVSMAQDAEK